MDNKPEQTNDKKYERVEQHYNRAEQHEGSLHAEGNVTYPAKPPLGPDPTRPSQDEPVIDPADEPITMGDSPPVQLEDLKTSQDSREA